MTATRWLVVVGSAPNVILACVALRYGNTTGGAVVLGMTAAWLGWVFSGDRG